MPGKVQRGVDFFRSFTPRPLSNFPLSRSFLYSFPSHLYFSPIPFICLSYRHLPPHLLVSFISLVSLSLPSSTRRYKRTVKR